MATLDRDVPAHDCRVELHELEKRHPNLGLGSRATCSCGKRWRLGSDLEQMFNMAFLRTRWSRVDRLDGTPDTL
jgi:hypothetical protein